MADRFRIKTRQIARAIPAVLLLMAMAAPGAAGTGVLPAPASPAESDDRHASCVTMLLRPPPCPLWYWHATVLAIDSVAPVSVPTSRPVDRNGVTRTAMGAAVVATSIAAATVVDVQLRHVLRADDPDQPAKLSDLGNLLGNGQIVVLATGATYGLSRLTGYEELADAAGRTLAVLVAAGVVNGTLKASVGRARPRVGVGSSGFRLFTMNNSWQSFPSGHALTAFALATVIASETDLAWVTGLGYGAAGLVAWSRTHEDRHWVSDVVAGAAIGTLVARYTLHRLDHRNSGGDLSDRLRLLVGPAMLGVELPFR